MSATITETLYVPSGGSLQLVSKLYGTIGGSGSTSIVIAPGANTTNVTGSLGMKKILNTYLTKTNSTATTFIAVKTYDNTQDGDIVTITCTSGDTFDFCVEGIDYGLTPAQS